MYAEAEQTLLTYLLKEGYLSSLFLKRLLANMK